MRCTNKINKLNIENSKIKKTKAQIFDNKKK